MKLYSGIAIVFMLVFQSFCVAQIKNSASPSLKQLFLHPPDAAKPEMLWMWMGANISTTGITKDLEALQEEGFRSTTIISLADMTDPLGVPIANDPTPDIIAWTEPWWQMVKHAATESKRLNMQMGLFDGAGYSTSGGTWITPELSMQELCWSKKAIQGNETQQHISLDKPTVELHANARFPTYVADSGKTVREVIKERGTYYKDIAVIAMPAKDTVMKSQVIDLTSFLKPDGTVNWQVPEGEWTIYRFGHTVMGEKSQPAQWQAAGFECDKLSKEAVSFHLDHVINEMQRHLGNLVGNTVDHIYFDSYEENEATWTPKMREDFLQRRGYDLLPFLAAFAGRTIEGLIQTQQFKNDFALTISDLFRDVYFTTIAEKLKKAHLQFYCEPYGGSWKVDEVVPLISNVMGEFWTDQGVFSPYELDGLLKPVQRKGEQIFAAEAFTGQPAYSRWTETPAWLKPIADAAFCMGINRLIIHRFAQQPWDDKYKPGAAMGQWGTHFDRTQTWWKPAKAFVEYLQRCEAMLQRGRQVAQTTDDFGLQLSNMQLVIKETHRKKDNTDVYFVTNTSRYTGDAVCAFNVAGKQPELWDAVTGIMRKLYNYKISNNKTYIPLSFDDAQSFFIVFDQKINIRADTNKLNFAKKNCITSIDSNWMISFDSVWGGPSKPVLFSSLSDWTINKDEGIKYYSGTATYTNTFFINDTMLLHQHKNFYINLGKINCIAEVYINGKDAGVVWTAPWRIAVNTSWLKKKNTITINVTNVWANRLIGDEQQPDDVEWSPNEYFYNSGKYIKEFPQWFLHNTPRPSVKRYCFTTWNYFDTDSPLIPSGLLGPVQLEYQVY